MDFYGLKQRGAMMIDSSIKGVKNFPIDGLILKIETVTGLGERFVRDRLKRLAKMDHISIDIQKDEVTWNDR